MVGGTEHQADAEKASSAPELAILQELVSAQAAELARLRGEVQLRDMALNATPAHFFIAKYESPESILVYCNRALAEHHGYQRDEMIGKSVRTISPYIWSAEHYQRLRAMLSVGEQFQFEEEIARRDGSTFWSGTTITPFRDAQGKVTHTVSIGADITQKRAAAQRQQELQEQLVNEMKEREKVLLELRMAQKLEAVGRLAAGVAHEINTPIQYVGDSLYFLRGAMEDIIGLLDRQGAALDALPDGPEVQSMRQSMLEAAESVDLQFLLDEAPKAFERTFDGVTRVSQIVRAMKEFSHPDASTFSSADINHALQNTLVVATNEYKYLARVVTALDPGLPLVLCNIGELNQVFLNLIVNAAHAIQDSGKDAGSGEIRIATAVEGDAVAITVADNGCGISAENLEKIYDPFFTTKEVGRGTGQGLAITRSIVMDKHGGAVRVSSEVGKGTQFTIVLPVNGRPDKEAQ